MKINIPKSTDIFQTANLVVWNGLDLWNLGVGELTLTIKFIDCYDSRLKAWNLPYIMCWQWLRHRSRHLICRWINIAWRDLRSLCIKPWVQNYTHQIVFQEINENFHNLKAAWWNFSNISKLREDYCEQWIPSRVSMHLDIKTRLLFYRILNAE